MTPVALGSKEIYACKASEAARVLVLVYIASYAARSALAEATRSPFWRAPN